MKNNMRQLFTKDKSRHEISIFARILIPILVVMFLEIIIFSYFIFFGAISKNLKRNTYSVFNNIIKVRAKEIEHKMKKEWGNLNFYSEKISKEYENFIKKHGIVSLEKESDEHAFLSDISPYLLNVMRENSVNGAYIILVKNDDKLESNVERNAIALCDLDPTVGTRGNKDLITVVAPFSVAEEMDNVLSNDWQARYKIKPSDDFYFEPIKIVQKKKKIYGDLGYWTFNHCLVETNFYGISYSVPLLDKQGKVFAVFGIEISGSHISRFLPFTELLDNANASYILAEHANTMNDYKKIADSGFLYKDVLNNADKFKLSFKNEKIKSISSYDDVYFNKEIIVGMHKINLSDGKVKLKNNGLVILGFVYKEDLFKFYDNFFFIIFVLMVGCVLLGLIAIFIVAKIIASPIVRLSYAVKSYTPSEHRNLKYTGLTEIDNLIRSIENLSIRIYEKQKSFSQILKMTKLPVGAFEYNTIYNEIHFTDTFFDVLKVPEINTTEITTFSDYQDFISKIEKYIYEKEGPNSVLYKIPQNQTKDIFVRYYQSVADNYILGTVIDITSDMLEKIQIKHDRDTDILTQLYNRRAFMVKLENFFTKPDKTKKAVLIMMDVDKLKYVNDNFGHKYGDSLIKKAAENLSKVTDSSAIAARLSGDEFIIFAYDLDSVEEIASKVEIINTRIKNSTIDLPNGEKYSLSMSGGYSIYPYDSEDYHKLLQYADIAMYKMKKERRGHFVHFSKDFLEDD